MPHAPLGPASGSVAPRTEVVEGNVLDRASLDVPFGACTRPTTSFIPWAPRDRVPADHERPNLIVLGVLGIALGVGLLDGPHAPILTILPATIALSAIALTTLLRSSPTDARRAHPSGSHAASCSRRPHSSS